MVSRMVKSPLAAFVFVLGIVVSPAYQLRALAAEPPARIISTLPSITEMLFALGLGDRVVAVSQHCRYPPQVVALPKVGTFAKPDLERIIALKANLVVINDRDTGDFADRLEAVQVPFVAVPSRTLSDVTLAIRKIGAAAGIEAHAREVAEDIERRLDDIRRLAVANRRPKVLLIIGRNPEALTGMVAAGRDSYLNELITIAGGTNVLDVPGISPYPHVSLENVLHLQPDVIVDVIDMSTIAAARTRRADASRELWRRFRTIPAVRNGRVYADAIDALVVPGPRVVDTAAWLAELIREPSRP
jgi:iron complex transport system substrate-binding protein